MAHVLLFHHVLGLTVGVEEFAERLAAGDHTVHTPDLYEGDIASSFEEGFELHQRIGDGLAAKIDSILADLPTDLVYAGISMGVMNAQRLAQTRSDARAALLYEACAPVTGEWAFGPWPDGVRVQVHGMDDDEFFAHEGDLDAARELVEIVGGATAELFTYPGGNHLFTDSSLPSYDATATQLVIERSRDLLDQVG